MNKRNKIIVSIVGITIVLLALLGITYAYYLTRIEGNTNTNSISITTANLKLVYGDGNGIISAQNIIPGTVVGTKEFTVSNLGNTTIDNYAVVLEYANILDESDNSIVPSVFERPQDFKFSLTCKDQNNIDCNGNIINFNNESLTLTTSSIDPDEIHNYKLVVEYLEAGVDQSNDMGKNLNLKVQIYNVADTVDITGSISGVDGSNTLKLESNPKLSTLLKNGESYIYSFSSVEVGTHKLSLLDESGNVLKTQYIVVSSGDDVGVSTTDVTVKDDDNNDTTLNDVTKITFNENIRKANLKISIDMINDSFTTDISSSSTSVFNPYEGNKNSLAYNILNNSITKKNNTEFRDTPISKPYLEPSYLYKDGGPGTSYRDVGGSSGYSSRYYTYGDSYTYDSSTKKYTIYNADSSPVSYVKGFSSLQGKYITDYIGEYDAKLDTYQNVSTIYYVSDVLESVFYYTTMNYNGVADNQKYLTYADSYEFDSRTGLYSLYNQDGSPVKAARLSDEYQTLIGKYIVDSYRDYNDYTVLEHENLSSIRLFNDSTNGHIYYYSTIRKSTEVDNNEIILTKEPDDYGNSYYYRGAVLDNYVEFNGMCWRIIRIQGDGSVKLTLAKDGTCSSITTEDTYSALINGNTKYVYGYSNESGYNLADYVNNTTGKTKSYLGVNEVLTSWYDEKIKGSSSEQYVKNNTWCLGGSLDYKFDSNALLSDASLEEQSFVYYTPYKFSKFQKPSLKCTSYEDKYTSEIGTLTADETYFAGAANGTSNNTFYLDANADFNYWTLSRSDFSTEETYVNRYDTVSHYDSAYYVNTSGSLYTSMVYYQNTDNFGPACGSCTDCCYVTYNAYGRGVRPVISLVSGVEITSGDGTQTNPYVIK